MKYLRYLLLVAVVISLMLAMTSCDINGILGMLGVGPGGEPGDGEGGGGIFGELEHECVYLAYKTEKEATCTETGRESRSCIICGDSEEREILALGHTKVTDPRVEPKCNAMGKTEGSHCLTCGETIVAQKTIDKLPHTEEVIPATEDKTAGVRCAVCEEIITKPEWIFASEFESPESYNGYYAYNYLQNKANGAALQAFYDRIDEVADAYHLGEISAALDSDSYVIDEIYYSDLGLSLNEALTVWTSYIYDHPLYYWISKSVKYVNSDEVGRIYLISYPEYADIATRLETNELIYEKVEEYVDAVAEESNVYGITLALHDMIIESSYYAYESDGVTPENAVWAHNILGIMTLGTGVCESYAKTFQLILNFVEIDNVYVTGTSRGEAHAWNLVEVEEGKWYWYDLTWDDTPNWLRGTSYNYFCVNDTDNTNWYDAQADFNFDTVTFVENHAVTAPDVFGINYLYGLPKRASASFDQDELILRDTFTLDGLTYAFIGSGEVQLIAIEKSGDITIPECVTYLGESYEVVAIGRMDEGGYYFESDKISTLDVTSVTVPKTVEYIYYGAFNISTLKSISVDLENEYYASLDGVLYLSDYSEIEWIPRKISGEVEIHSAAKNFSNYYFNSQDITSVTLHKNITEIGDNAFYSCINLKAIYFDGTTAEWENIPKGNNWAKGSSFTVFCSNGVITVN